MAGYRILTDNSKLNYILQTEGKCPCCGSNRVSYQEKPTHTIKRRNARQFFYSCNSCKSNWEGNYYTKDLLLI